jgi:hypothetical protein
VNDRPPQPTAGIDPYAHLAEVDGYLRRLAEYRADFAALLAAGDPALADLQLPPVPAPPRRGPGLECLQAPRKVWWGGQPRRLAPRLWHLLHAILSNGKAVIPFHFFTDDLYKDQKHADKRLKNDLSALNGELSFIKWPATYRTESGFLLVDNDLRPESHDRGPAVDRRRAQSN